MTHLTLPVDEFGIWNLQHPEHPGVSHQRTALPPLLNSLESVRSIFALERVVGAALFLPLDYSTFSEPPLMFSIPGPSCPVTPSGAGTHPLITPKAMTHTLLAPTELPCLSSWEIPHSTMHSLLKKNNVSKFTSEYLFKYVYYFLVNLFYLFYLF